MATKYNFDTGLSNTNAPSSDLQTEGWQDLQVLTAEDLNVYMEQANNWSGDYKSLNTISAATLSIPDAGQPNYSLFVLTSPTGCLVTLNPGTLNVGFIITLYNNTSVSSYYNTTIDATRHSISPFSYFRILVISTTQVVGINGSGTASSGENNLINSNLWRWSFGNSFTIAAASTVTPIADRWYYGGGAASSGTAVITMEEVNTDNLILSTIYANSDYFMKIIYTTGTGGAQVLYKKEMGAASYSNQNIAITFGLKSICSAAQNYTVSLVQDFGTGGSPDANVVVSLGGFTIPSGTQCGYFTVFGNIPSIAEKTLGTDNNDFIYITLANDNQDNTLSITSIQVDVNQAPSVYRGKSYAEEYLACAAYRETNYPNGVAPGTSMTTGNSYYTTGVSIYRTTDGTFFYMVYNFSDNFKTEKIATPTVDIYSWDGTANNISAVGNGNSAITTSGTPTTLGIGIYIADTVPESTDGSITCSAYWVADTGF